jgi:hypothetical protein
MPTPHPAHARAHQVTSKAYDHFFVECLGRTDADGRRWLDAERQRVSWAQHVRYERMEELELWHIRASGSGMTHELAACGTRDTRPVAASGPIRLGLPDSELMELTCTHHSEGHS